MIDNEAVARLFEAIENDDGAAVRELLEGDPALASARNADGVSAVLLAQYRHRFKLARRLVDAGATLDLFEAAATGATERVVALADGHSGRAPDGMSALHLAAYFGHLDAARVLLDRGADPASRAGWLQPIHSAVAGRAPDLVALLLERGADPNAQQQGGWTALHAAAKQGDAALVTALLAAGATPDLAADSGATAADLTSDDAIRALLSESRE